MLPAASPPTVPAPGGAPASAAADAARRASPSIRPSALASSSLFPSTNPSPPPSTALPCLGPAIPPPLLPPASLLVGSSPPVAAALGSNTRSTAAPPAGEDDRAGGDDRAAAARLERFRLQAVARACVPRERVAFCLRARLPDAAGVGVWHAPEHGSAHYSGLMVCGSAWLCPVCAAKLAERSRAELAEAIAAWRAVGGQVALVTYTLAHERADDLGATLGGFLAAQESMTGTRAYRALRGVWGVVGAIKALEVTWGAAHGWHPHCHTLLFLRDGVDIEGAADELYRCWSAALGRRGLRCTRERGVVVQRGFGAVEEYVTKYGRAWDLPDELTKAHIKRGRGGRHSPWDLLRWFAETGEVQARALFREYAAVFKGRRRLVFSPDLRDRLGLGAERSDEELAAVVVADAVLLATLSAEAWAAVRRADRRGELLEVARSGDAGAVRRFVADLVRRSRPAVPRAGPPRAQGRALGGAILGYPVSG